MRRGSLAGSTQPDMREKLQPEALGKEEQYDESRAAKGDLRDTFGGAAPNQYRPTRAATTAGLAARPARASAAAPA
jgi:hypothetical protein